MSILTVKALPEAGQEKPAGVVDAISPMEKLL
jgi:hypothetical protein